MPRQLSLYFRAIVAQYLHAPLSAIAYEHFAAGDRRYAAYAFSRLPCADYSRHGHIFHQMIFDYCRAIAFDAYCLFYGQGAVSYFGVDERRRHIRLTFTPDDRRYRHMRACCVTSSLASRAQAPRTFISSQYLSRQIDCRHGPYRHSRQTRSHARVEKHLGLLFGVFES